WARELLAGFFGIGVDVIDDALDERVLETFGDGLVAPFVVDFRLLLAAALSLERFGVLDEALGGVFAAIEDDVLDALKELRLQLLIDGELAGVDDGHVETRLDGVI